MLEYGVWDEDDTTLYHVYTTGIIPVSGDESSSVPLLGELCRGEGTAECLRSRKWESEPIRWLPLGGRGIYHNCRSSPRPYSSEGAIELHTDRVQGCLFVPTSVPTSRSDEWSSLVTRVDWAADIHGAWTSVAKWPLEADWRDNTVGCCSMFGI